MGYGSTGKVLRVDLSSNTIDIETFDEAFYRRYPGGKALAGYYLLKENPVGVDPLGPENTFVFAGGLVTGSPISVSTRFTTAARSPLTGCYGESEAGGFWGPELKFSGYDVVILKGRAERPVYLWIKDGNAEIRDARHLWGRAPHEAQDAIRSEFGDSRIRVLQIGKGGENLVRYACVTNELRHFNGRTGMGAVMGSKNLKAIAVRGSGRYAEIAFDPDKVAQLGKHLAKSFRDHPLGWALHEKGTPAGVGLLNAAGILPTRNFRQGAFEGVEGILWEAFNEQVLKRHHTCFSCAIACKQGVEVDERYQVSSAYGGPEYETIASCGSCCGVDDIQAVAKANELCNSYTLDTISTGATIAFAMECFENGLIGLEDTGGIDLRFGNADAMLEMIELIARREGFGDLLAEGSLSAAKKIGGHALDYAMQVKGQELPMHDPRGKTGVGLGYAVSDTGADHLTSIHDTMITSEDAVAFQGARALGLQNALSALDLSDRKSEQYFLLENWISFGKVAGFCFFGPTPRGYVQVDDVLEIVRAASGWDVTLEELLTIGERATNLARAYNVREGFSRKDDILPERLFSPLENGALKGVSISREEFEHALTVLYEKKGWNPDTGAPTRQRLDELDIGWVSDLAGAL